MGNLTMSRRTFVKTAAITGAAAAAFGASTHTALAEETYSSVSGNDTVAVKTCCRGCGKMECGVKVIVQNGRAIRVEGDEGAFQSMGNCCTKSQSSIQAAYHPDRLHYPMKRTNPKGEEPGWQRISWDEAMQSIVDNFLDIKAKHGGEAIACQVGTSRIWCMHSESILKNMLETPNNVEAWQICKGPRHFATTMVSQFAMSWMETITRPKVYVQWGGASELSNYDDSCRTTVDVASRADVHISVDPRMANMGKEADYWQHLRPGTDGALALAWTNVIIEKKLYDDLYVKKWTNAPFLVCEDMEPSGFPTVRTDGSYWDVKTALLKESDIKEGGSPYKFLVYDNNWEKLKAEGIEHEYGAFTWFNADQEGVIDETGGFWEGENYDSEKARQGREAAQDNLLPGQTQGWLPDPMPFDPAIDPALEGEFEITLKDGKTVKVKPVWEHYKARAAEYKPEVAAEITGIPASEIEAAATVVLRPVPRLRQRRHPVHAGGRALLQRHPELQRLRQPRGHHRQHGHPGRQPRPDHRPHRRRPPGLQRLGPRRHHPAGGSQPQADRHRQVPASGLVAVLVRQPFAVGRRHHGRPLPGARPLERVRQLHEPDEHHARLGGPVLA